MKDTRPLSIVKLAEMPKEMHDEYVSILGRHSLDRYVYIGEIPNMRGHALILNDETGKYTILHIENFVEIPEDDV